jgi:hypothetical protein
VALPKTAGHCLLPSDVNVAAGSASVSLSSERHCKIEGDGRRFGGKDCDATPPFCPLRSGAVAGWRCRVGGCRTGRAIAGLAAMSERQAQCWRCINIRPGGLGSPIVGLADCAEGLTTVDRPTANAWVP